MSHHFSGPKVGFPRGDARLDFTDLYAFPKPGDPSKSILIMNVHPSAGLNPPGPTTTEPFAPEALYEIKIDTDGRVPQASAAFSIPLNTAWVPHSFREAAGFAVERKGWDSRISNLTV